LAKSSSAPVTFYSEMFMYLLDLDY